MQSRDGTGIYADHFPDFTKKVKGERVDRGPDFYRPLQWVINPHPLFIYPLEESAYILHLVNKKPPRVRIRERRGGCCLCLKRGFGLLAHDGLPLWMKISLQRQWCPARAGLSTEKPPDGDRGGFPCVQIQTKGQKRKNDLPHHIDRGRSPCQEKGAGGCQRLFQVSGQWGSHDHSIEPARVKSLFHQNSGGAHVFQPQQIVGFPHGHIRYFRYLLHNTHFKMGTVKGALMWKRKDLHVPPASGILKRLVGSSYPRKREGHIPLPLSGDRGQLNFFWGKFLG